MGADSLAENTQNAQEFVCASPKVLDFNEKRLHLASVVRGPSKGAQLQIGGLAAKSEIWYTIRHYFA